MPDWQEKKNLSIKRLTKGKLPRLPFWQLKNEVLGKKYSLSIAFIDPETSKRVNRDYRGKNKPADILSFPFAKNEGEILVSLETARKQAKNFEQSERKFLIFLLIHGMLHLKGHVHGSKMERKEAYFIRKLKL